MASTNKTVNYELSQFEGTDKPSWEADYNADMLAIDTNLKAVSNVANGASGDISTLDGRLTTAEGNINTNANDIDALEARADALEAGQTSDDGRLDALEAEQIVQNTAIESNTRLGYNLARPYDSASTYAVNAYVLFQDTLYKCTTAVTTGEAFDPTKWLAIKATDEIAAGGSFTQLHASSSTIGNYITFNSVTLNNQSTTATFTPLDMDYFIINNVRIFKLRGFISNIPATTGRGMYAVDIYGSRTSSFELPNYISNDRYTPIITTGFQSFLGTTNENQTLFPAVAAVEGIGPSSVTGSDTRIRFGITYDPSTSTNRRFDFNLLSIYAL